MKVRKIYFKCTLYFLKYHEIGQIFISSQFISNFHLLLILHSMQYYPQIIGSIFNCSKIIYQYQLYSPTGIVDIGGIMNINHLLFHIHFHMKFTA
jgi:hypothetical protein